MELRPEWVANEVATAFDELFNTLDRQRTLAGAKPSSLERMIDNESWGLGDDYREWFELSGDPYE